MEEIKYYFENIDKLFERRKINILENKYDWIMNNVFIIKVIFVGLEN